MELILISSDDEVIQNTESGKNSKKELDSELGTVSITSDEVDEDVKTSKLIPVKGMGEETPRPTRSITKKPQSRISDSDSSPDERIKSSTESSKTSGLGFEESDSDVEPIHKRRVLNSSRDSDDDGSRGKQAGDGSQKKPIKRKVVSDTESSTPPPRTKSAGRKKARFTTLKDSPPKEKPEKSIESLFTSESSQESEGELRKPQASQNIIIESDTSEDIANPFKKRKFKQDSSDSDIVTPHTRSKQQLSRKEEKRVTRSMGTSPEYYSLPSSEEVEVEPQRPKKRKKKKIVEEVEEVEDPFEDIVSDSSQSYDYSPKTLYCHLCKSKQPFDNFSTKQQHEYVDHERYCLNHTWAGGQQNYIDRLENRTKAWQRLVERYDRLSSDHKVQSDYESDDFITRDEELSDL